MEGRDKEKPEGAGFLFKPASCLLIDADTMSKWGQESVVVFNDVVSSCPFLFCSLIML